MLTAYYFAAAEPYDLIAIKPHASPVYHAIQYLLGNLSRERLLQFRSFGGLQAYPSRLKDPDGVHFSTGSVGFGAVMPNFMSLVRRYVEDHFGYHKPHRFLALMGDAELDEGNIWEALGEDSLQRLGRVIWMIDLNRQSLDRVVPSGRAQKIAGLLRSFGCHVIEVKYGAKLEALFARPGGERLRERIDRMSNDEYQSLLRTAEPRVARRPTLPFRRPAGRRPGAIAGAGGSGRDRRVHCRSGRSRPGQDSGCLQGSQHRRRPSGRHCRLHGERLAAPDCRRSG